MLMYTLRPTADYLNRQRSKAMGELLHTQNNYGYD